MRIIGSQTREKLEDTKYTLLEQTRSDAILLNTKTNIKELWVKRDDHAGYVIEINGIGYEFVRSIN